MLEVQFYETHAVEDKLLRFAVIVSRCNGKWVFCKHRERDTFEVPGGHREPGEAIDEAARRELYEETGAEEYTLCPICVYSVADRKKNQAKSFGMLYLADIIRFGKLPEGTEMERIELFDMLPEKLTYPAIQPALMERVQGFSNKQKMNRTSCPVRFFIYSRCAGRAEA